MKLSDQIRARLAELRGKSKELFDKRGVLIDTAMAEKRGLADTEQATYDTLTAEKRTLDAQIAPLEDRLREVEAQEASETRAAASRVEMGETGEQHHSPAQVTDPPVYLSNGGNGNSYFRDLARRSLGMVDAHEAIERLQRNNKAVLAEKRALGNTNTTGGSGGEFAPPQWLIDEYINIARPGRVTADLMQKGDVPDGVSSINLPKLLTGTSVALQTSQNSALSQTDITTGYVSTGFTTVGGKQVVSQQLLDQSAIPFDRVILADLAAAYATQIGQQVLTGAGTGVNNNSVVNGLANAVVPAGNQVLFTTAAPTAPLFYGACAAAYSAFVTARFAPPTCWLMHPRRFFWLVSKVDTSNRPLVVPTANAWNPMSTTVSPIPAGYSGDFMGLPVFTDPNVPIAGGVGTNEDKVYLLKADDLWLFESPLRVESFREPYADSVGVLFRAYSYLGTILNRRTTSIATISGTGLVTPVFGGN